MIINNNKILLLDKTIKDIQIIINSIKSNVLYIVIDYEIDTFETILNSISKLNITNIYQIGLVTEYNNINEYNYINEPINDFLKTLINLYNLQIFDFISCKLNIYYNK